MASDTKIDVGYAMLGGLSLTLAVFTLVALLLGIWLPSWQLAATSGVTFLLTILTAWLAEEVS